MIILATSGPLGEGPAYMPFKMGLESGGQKLKSLLILFLLLFSFAIPILAVPEEVELPYSWIEDSIKITIHGVFFSDKQTKEGWVGEKEEQYKILIGYENTMTKRYQVETSLSRPIPGVGYLRLETDKGNIYDPKYAGGSTVHTPLQPKYQYTTHNYAFNIHKGEKPIKLYKYKSRNAEQPIMIFNLTILISPPIPESTRIIRVGETLKTKDFLFQPLSLNNTKYVINGPYKGKYYAMLKPKNGYKFIILKLKITNIGIERTEVPLYLRDGEFKVKVDRGYIYEDISASLSYNPGGGRWVKSAEDYDRRKYPILVDYAFSLNPEESIELVKAFEILENTEPIEFQFRLLGNIEDVFIKINNR